MSSFGPPGSGAPDDPYARPPAGPPVDPAPPQWGPAPAGDQPGYPPGQPGYPPEQPGYPPPGPFPPGGQPGGYPPPGPFPPVNQPGPAGPWGPPPPPGYGPPPVVPPAPRRGGRIALIIALVVVLLLCPCLALAGWGIWQAADDDGGSAAPTVPTGEPSDVPTAAPTTAEPSPTEDDDRDFARGDCVVNDGTDANADLRKVPCGPDTYEVLLRIPGTTDGDRCKTASPDATANFVSDNPVNALDYVLCLKKRTR
ncbi:hypothetical protein GA0070558_103137 [Micromonospora haikouensis]|uniref:Uncharacterized protein n=1 Tax=Micromonospora haikouensis TaxID=686309 RepID=A0A1C4UF40_9ACTN|nr:hypothetical protein [Micromonospora haikouensis]SCE70289.1 hypothetical protein GA0070558_103137 [Micromonospora haikouensis]